MFLHSLQVISPQGKCDDHPLLQTESQKVQAVCQSHTAKGKYSKNVMVLGSVALGLSSFSTIIECFAIKHITMSLTHIYGYKYYLYQKGKQKYFLLCLF